MADTYLTDAHLTDDNLVDLIASKTGIARCVLQRPAQIRDLGLRLEPYMAVLAAIEDRFDIEIEDLVAADCVTLGGLMDRLKARVEPPSTVLRRSA